VHSQPPSTALTVHPASVAAYGLWEEADRARDPDGPAAAPPHPRLDMCRVLYETVGYETALLDWKTKPSPRMTTQDLAERSWER